MNKLKLFPYSAYKLSIFDSCQYKFKLQYIDKIKIPDDQKFFEKGKFIHHALATYPKKTSFEFKLSSENDIKEYMVILQKVFNDENILKLLRNKKSNKERPFRIALDYSIINQGNQPIKYWEKDNTLFWGEIDYIGTNKGYPLVIDWKSGKYYSNKSTDQLKIYALWLFLLSEKVEKVECAYYYVEHETQDMYIYHRDSLTEIIDYFKNKINKIEEEKEFAKNPTNLCNYCNYMDQCKPFNLNMEKYNGNNIMESSCT